MDFQLSENIWIQYGFFLLNIQSISSLLRSLIIKSELYPTEIGFQVFPKIRAHENRP
jgi:hypothetical protein